jgi:hypothetical protein
MRNADGGISWEIPMSGKPSTARSLALNAERQRRWRQRHPRARKAIRPGDDHDERQAVIHACNALVGRLKDVLASPPEEQSAKVALWRLGLEQAIATIEQYRGEVRDLLASP